MKDNGKCVCGPRSADDQIRRRQNKERLALARQGHSRRKPGVRFFLSHTHTTAPAAILQRISAASTIAALLSPSTNHEGSRKHGGAAGRSTQYPTPVAGVVKQRPNAKAQHGNTKSAKLKRENGSTHRSDYRERSNLEHNGRHILQPQTSTHTHTSERTHNNPASTLSCWHAHPFGASRTPR